MVLMMKMMTMMKKLETAQYSLEDFNGIDPLLQSLTFLQKRLKLQQFPLAATEEERVPASLKALPPNDKAA